MSQSLANRTSSWPSPNHANSETRKPMMIGFLVSLTVLAAIAIASWVHVKFVSRRTVGTEDFFLVFAAVWHLAAHYEQRSSLIEFRFWLSPLRYVKGSRRNTSLDITSGIVRRNGDVTLSPERYCLLSNRPAVTHRN